MMLNLFDHPALICGISLVVLWISAWIGSGVRARQRDVTEDARGDVAIILGGALTLLGLIIGFTFSMAVTRYDQRKNYEEQEANAIGTEYVRADLLPSADAAKVRALLKRYLDQRILSYTPGEGPERQQVGAATARLQAELWSALLGPAAAAPTPVTALVLAGMNDVLNSQGYTQAAWWNRIPTEAWILLATISIFCNLLVGYVAHGRSALLFLILPIALSVSLFLIADIDTPLNGVIRVIPQNLVSLAGSLQAP